MAFPDSSSVLDKLQSATFFSCYTSLEIVDSSPPKIVKCNWRSAITPFINVLQNWNSLKKSKRMCNGCGTNSNTQTTLGCVIAQAFFSRGVSLKSRVLSAGLSVI